MKTFIKKITSVLLILEIMIMSLMTFNSKVYGYITDSTGNYRYNFAGNNTITIDNYIGTEKNNIVIPSTIDGYKVIGIENMAFYSKELTGTITIPEGITTIGADAFGINPGLSGTLTLPSTLTSIDPSFIRDISESEHNSITRIEIASGNNYFSTQDGILYNKNKTKLIKCPPGKSVTDLTIPETVTEIGNEAFLYCTNLRGKINFPSNLKIIGEEAFSCCSGLTGELEFPQTLTNIKYRAFFNCDNIQGTLTLPNNLIEIGSEAFYWCGNLVGELIIPDQITIINEQAFMQTGFTSIKFPEGLTTIGTGAFEQCLSLEGELQLPSTLKEIGDYAFEACWGITGDLTIPEGVTTIGKRAFLDCILIDGNLTLPSTLTTIGERAFEECTRLTGDIIIPEGVTTIGENAFYNCNNIEGDIIIPSSVETIGAGALYNTNAENLIFLDTVPAGLTKTDLPTNENLKIYCKKGTISEEIKSSYNTIEFDEITEKANYILNGKNAKETVAINNDLKDIVTIESLKIENTNIAKINEAVITPVSDGKTNLIVTLKYLDMQVAEVKVPVTVMNSNIEDPDPIEIPITGITLDKTEITLEEGKIEFLTALITPDNTTQDKTITWKSEHPNIVTVDNVGKITGIAPGTAKITATTSNGLTATCTVTIKEAAPDPGKYPITEVSLSMTTLNLHVGDLWGLLVYVNPVNSTQSREVEWESSNLEVVTVDQNGQLEAVGEGTATIRVTAIANGMYAECKVTVTKLPIDVDVPIKGDINNDGELTAGDLNYGLRKLGLGGITEDEIKRGDVTGEGEYTGADLNRLLRYLGGILENL